MRKPGSLVGAGLVLGLVLTSPALLGGEVLHYTNLVGRLTNLERLSTLPPQGNTVEQWSSYGRNSYYDTNSNRYIDWAANNDCCDFIRLEGGQQVLAEMQGPGCIWRIWSATPGNGRVRVYLDGSDSPAIDLPFIGFFNGQNPPFNRSNLVHTTAANGWNNYTPIPYQHSCRIVAEPDWGLYYHFTYEKFPPGTVVSPFTPDLAPAESAALDRANAALSNSGVDPAGMRIGQETWTTTVVAAPASAQTLWNKTGSGAITGFRIKLNPAPAEGDYDALRELVLQMKWDGETEPSVWCPLGDFFGTAPGANVYKSLPLGHTADGWWYSYWHMPFATAARVEILNEGNTSRQVTCEVTHAPLAGPAENLGRFHAKWHRNLFLPVEPERAIDWPVLKTTGSGRFVGMMLHVWNPRGGWWGEGDEKFFVDGEKFPSTFGTGSEDYFGYAWSSGIEFEHPYHNQTHNDGESRGHLSVNRWHLADAIPFTTAFEGCIEKYFSDARPTLYAATAYWYLAPGGADPYPPTPLPERIGYWSPLEVYAVPGVLEGESLSILQVSGGTVQIQPMTDFAGDRWSGEAQLWWTGGQPGNRIDLEFSVTNAGNYKVLFQLTKARDYGIVQLYLDNTPLGDPIDLYDPSVVTTGPLEAGLLYFSAGKHTFSLQLAGANPNAIPAYMAGLDYLKLEPALRVVDALLARYPANEVAVVFNSAVNPATATNISNYSFANATEIRGARMGAGADTVLLRTAPLPPGATNLLRVSNVKDLAAFPNVVPNSTVRVEERLNTWLRMDAPLEAAGLDSSGTAKHAALRGGAAPIQHGQMLGGLWFDGQDAYVQLAEGYSDFTHGMTIALWAQPSAVGNWARFLDFGNGNNADNILLARNGTTDRVTFEIYKGGVSGGKVSTPPGTLQLGQWHHIAATMDPAGRTILYVNAVPVASGKTAVPDIVPRANNFLGKSNWIIDDYYEGALDDLRIYDRVLESPAIKALARESTGLKIPAIAATATKGQWILTFEGRLLASDQLEPANWQPVSNAVASPYIVPLNSPRKFFRTVSP